MTTHSIPAFYRSLRQKFQGIDPYVSTWDYIKIEQLLSIEVFLNGKEERNHVCFKFKVLSVINMTYW